VTTLLTLTLALLVIHCALLPKANRNG